jgi:putative endonuclease
MESEGHMKHFYTYILANAKNGTIYVGMTGNLEQRLQTHKQHLIEGFTSQYDVTKLVHLEIFSTAMEAILREKQIKHWKREWKIKLIEEKNPYWEELTEKEGFEF